MTNTLLENTNDIKPDVKPDVKDVHPKKRIKGRMCRDANAPKKPHTSYNLFLADYKDQILAEHHGKLYHLELNRLMGEKWKNIPDEEKAKYQNQAKVLREKYEEDWKKYKKTSHYREFQMKLKIDKKKKKGDGLNGSRMLPDDVPIFSERFLDYNKKREAHLRDVRSRSNNALDENTQLRKRLDVLRHQRLANTDSRTQLDVIATQAKEYLHDIALAIKSHNDAYLSVEMKQAEPNDKFLDSFFELIGKRSVPGPVPRYIQTIRCNMKTFKL